MLLLDNAASELAGRLRAVRESRGRPLSIGDAMIAAICIVHGATLATRNVRDFDGLDLKLVNPFEKAA
jgi:predicted nucleic acid-binding protein